MSNITTKHPAETVRVSFDFTPWLVAGETIDTAVLTIEVLDGEDLAPTDVLQGAPAISGAKVLQGVTAGVAGASYNLLAEVSTSLGQVLALAGVLSISDSAAKSYLFRRALIIPQMRRDQLMVLAQSYLDGVEFTDDYLWSKVLAAEALLERHLRVFLSPVEVVPQGTPQAEVDALVAAGERIVEEPGYDFHPDLFRGDKWGMLELRHTPIIHVHSIRFAYPGLGDQLFTVPESWIRTDKKYGTVNLVPTQSTLTLPLNAYILSAYGGGRTIPLMVQVRYRTGIENAAAKYPDVLDVVKKMAVLSILSDLFLPHSGSISMDGLSESLSVDMSKYQGQIDEKIETLRQAIVGPRLMVF